MKAATHTKLGFDAENGGVVVLRPVGHIVCATRFVEGSGTVDALNGYFGPFATKPLGDDGDSRTRLRCYISSYWQRLVVACCFL